MTRSRRGGRALFLVCALGALGVSAVLTSGCDVSPPAATVDGVTITQNQLNTQLTEVIDNPYARCLLEIEGTEPSSLSGAGTDTVSTQFASQQLSTMILDELVAQDLVRRHASPGPSAVSAARSDFEYQLTTATSSGASPCGVTGSELLDQLPGPFATLVVGNYADEEQLAAVLGHLDLSEGALRSYYRSHLSQFSELCLSDIEVASQSQAQSIRNQITSGASSFAAEARQYSLDEASAPDGGAYACALSSQVTNTSVLQAIGMLGVGQVSQPVSIEDPTTGTTGWFLWQVNGRPELPFAQAVSQIRATLFASEDEAVSREFSRITQDAHVSVDPQYGTWSEIMGVTPPVPPPSKDLLSSSADVPAQAS